jgi:hypothetical protein
MSEKVLRWIARIGAAVINPTEFFLRTKYPPSHEKGVESALEEAGAIVAATESVVANVKTTKSSTVPVTAGVRIDGDAQIDSAASAVLDQEEIHRRRDLVRLLFNDFWSGAYEKPASFVDRLDQAEDYVNDRLAETGEFWQLNAKTRLTLGLPPRSHSSNNGKNRAARD